jgi:hypothetical protein
MRRSRAPSIRAKVKATREPRLKANQLKIIQYLLSAASYVSVLESAPMRGNKMRDYMEK